MGDVERRYLKAELSKSFPVRLGYEAMMRIQRSGLTLKLMPVDEMRNRLLQEYKVEQCALACVRGSSKSFNNLHPKSTVVIHLAIFPWLKPSVSLNTLQASFEMSTNRSVWQDKPGVPGVIREDPIPTLEENQLRIKVHSWAVNPCDVILQDTPLPIVTYPVVLGQDVAGIVEEVGKAATSKFKVGDRVFGFSYNNGFKEHVTLNVTRAALLPESLSFTEVSVFPLVIVTASYALFAKDFLALSKPSVNPIGTGRSILIWGGSSGVGSNAIQLAKAAGF